jgi:hypothetical protein
MYARIFLMLLGLLLIYLGKKQILEPLLMIPMGLGMATINASTLIMPGGAQGNLFVDPLEIDINKLLDLLQELVDQGNTVVVIEHQLDVIKACDFVVDLGPEGGKGGGRIVAEGTPEIVAKAKGSETGRFLRPMLNI